jgi:hypothetical protein
VRPFGLYSSLSYVIEGKMRKVRPKRKLSGSNNNGLRVSGTFRPRSFQDVLVDFSGLGFFAFPE